MKLEILKQGQTWTDDTGILWTVGKIFKTVHSLTCNCCNETVKSLSNKAVYRDMLRDSFKKRK